MRPDIKNKSGGGLAAVPIQFAVTISTPWTCETPILRRQPMRPVDSSEMSSAIAIATLEGEPS